MFLSLSLSLRPIAAAQVLLALTACLSLAGCQQRATDEAASGSAADAPAKASIANMSVADGAPRIADSSDGVHIEYRVRGQGGPLVVLIHGWSCDANYWREQLKPLTEKYTVLTVDLAGHGASGRNRSDWSMAQFGADVAAAVRAYQGSDRAAPAQVVLVGHSMGGPVAVEAARALGSAVLGVIGVDTFKTLGAPPPNPAEIQARLQAFESDFIGSVRGMVAQAFFTPTADPAFVRQIADDMSAAPPQVALPAIRGLNSWLGTRDLSDVKVPIVAINSDLGGVTEDARIRKIAPTFRSVTLAGRGHFLMMEDPVGFNPVLLQEITALTPKT
jgi:pimeloyl-ACP methyl ester carboxylesterase